MSDATALMASLNEAGLNYRIDKFGCLHLSRGPIRSFIVQRPHYCDRGRWMVYAESTDSRQLTIDWADGFPRYYFLDDSLVREMDEWFRVRLNNLNSVPDERFDTPEPEP